MLDTLKICADTFKVLGDRTRIKILTCLFDEDKNVCTISEQTGSSQSNTSHQLKILKDNRLVDYRKIGKEVQYYILDCHVKSIVKSMLDHAEHKCEEGTQNA